MTTVAEIQKWAAAVARRLCMVAEDREDVAGAAVLHGLVYIRRYPGALAAQVRHAVNNAATDAARKLFRRQCAPMPFGLGTSADVDRADSRLQVRLALGGASDDDWLMIQRRADDVEHSEIAAELGITLGTARMRCQRFQARARAVFAGASA